MTAPYPLALPSVEGPVFVLDQNVLDRGLKASRESPRRRIILPVQRSETAGVQRLLNFMQRSTYARPHFHPTPEHIETVMAVRGAVGFLVFNERGTVLSAHRLEAGNPASCMIDIEQGVWHTFLPLADDSVVLEIKRGPYNAATDKCFPTWAPEEGTAEALDYARSLEAEFQRSDASSLP